MIAWEYIMTLVDISYIKGSQMYVNPCYIWTPKGEQGKTGFDDIAQKGKEGWELVSVTPFAGTVGDSYAGVTNTVLFTFKRPIVERV